MTQFIDKKEKPRDSDIKPLGRPALTLGQTTQKTQHQICGIAD